MVWCRKKKMVKKSKQSRFPSAGIIGEELLVLFFVAMVVSWAYVSDASPDPVKKHRPIQFELSLLDDGTYRGAYEMGGEEYVVDIVIEAHRIKEITVIKGPERVFSKKCGLCEAVVMLKEALDTQSLPVDAYSGATRTTIAILRAVQAALSSPFEAAENTPSRTEAWR